MFYNRLWSWHDRFFLREQVYWIRGYGYTYGRHLVEMNDHFSSERILKADHVISPDHKRRFNWSFIYRRHPQHCIVFEAQADARGNWVLLPAGRGQV